MAKQQRNPQRLTPRDRVIAIVQSFDGASATPVLTHLKLEARKKRFGWYMDDHHGNGRIEINCKGRKGRSQELVAKNPAVYFVPSYHGKLGNIGIWLDVPGVDWDEVAEILLDAYGMVCPDVVLTRKRIPKRKAAPR